MASNFWGEFLTGFADSFTGSLKEDRAEQRDVRRSQRYGEAITRHRKETLAEQDRLRRKRGEEKRQQDLASMLEIGKGYGEEWDFQSPEAAEAYYKGPFLEEKKREREEGERFHKRQSLMDALQQQGKSPAEAEMHAGMAEMYPDLYRVFFPQPKGEDPTRKEDRQFRQRVQAAEDTLVDQIPGYFRMRPEDRQGLLAKVESFQRRSQPWYVAEDERGNPVIVPGNPPPEQPLAEEEEDEPSDPYGGQVPPEAQPGSALLDLLGGLFRGGEEGGYGLYEPPPAAARPAAGPKVKGIRRVK